MWKGVLGDMHEFIPFANQTGKCESPYYLSDPTHVFASILTVTQAWEDVLSDILNHSEALELKAILQVSSKENKK